MSTISKIKVGGTIYDIVRPIDAYPVGSIYLSVNNTSPAQLFGGTWEQLKDRFLLAAGNTYNAGSTGGEETHKLSTAEMPSHGHEMAPYMWAVSAAYSNGSHNIQGADGHGNTITYGEGKKLQTQYSENAGGGLAHNNMPPYLTVYMWKRIA